MLRRYAGLLEARPLLTKVVTSGVLLGSGDLCTQALVDRRVNWRRTGKFALLGALVVAPSLHVWYGFLARRFASSVAKRVALDQFVFAPAFLTGFIFLNSFLDYGDAGKAAGEVAKEIRPTLGANWLVWIPYQMLNFAFVPVPFQVLANNAMSLFWNSYLSYSLHRREEGGEVI